MLLTGTQGPRLPSSLNVHAADFINCWSWQRESTRAEGPWRGSLRKSKVQTAVTVSAFSLDACWGKRTVLFNFSALWRTCLMFSVLTKTCGAASPVLFLAWILVFPPAHEQKLKQRSVRPPLAGRQPLALSLLFTSASTPSLIKAKAARLLIWMSEEFRQLCSWRNQAGPKTADMNVFLPCSVCLSLVLGWLVVPADPALTYPRTPTEEDANESCWVSWAQVPPSTGAKS